MNKFYKHWFVLFCCIAMFVNPNDDNQQGADHTRVEIVSQDKNSQQAVFNKRMLYDLIIFVHTSQFDWEQYENGTDAQKKECRDQLIAFMQQKDPGIDAEEINTYLISLKSWSKQLVLDWPLIQYAQGYTIAQLIAQKFYEINQGHVGLARRITFDNILSIIDILKRTYPVVSMPVYHGELGKHYSDYLVYVVQREFDSLVFDEYNSNSRTDLYYFNFIPLVQRYGKTISYNLNSSHHQKKLSLDQSVLRAVQSLHNRALVAHNDELERDMWDLEDQISRFPQAMAYLMGYVQSLLWMRESSAIPIVPQQIKSIDVEMVQRVVDVVQKVKQKSV